MAENDKDRGNGAAEDRDEVAEALAGIFRQVGENSIASEGGATANWALDGSFHDCVRTAPHGPQLYDGISGVALFLAAYYLATNDQDARELALRSASQLHLVTRQGAANSGSARQHSNGTGGLAGIGSLPYALVQLAAWLKMPELLDSARDVATSITPGQIMTEERLDVMCGCAGTLLALLSFIEEVTAMGMDSGSAPDLALLCGRRLLERRVSYNSGPRAWPAADSFPLSGFAHGAAGIAYALVRLFQYTGQEEFRDAAIEGFAFERTLYIPELQTWFDPRCNLPLNKASWCEGAPGVALGILGSMIAIDSHALRHDLEQALSITRMLPEGPVDHLCCGNFGRVEIMNIAGSVLGRLQLTDHARQLATQLLARAATSGFRFQPSDHQAVSSGTPENNPSLFLGLAGVGYTLLRLNYPDLVPSVLLLETIV
ncbi:MAG TPA: lanthionine synthetase LanC family protein [Candidatus Angelobacter sp.]|nr:lanthionine synthetase LanC family protein [Candidatus Angelobacter sp.]